MKKHAIQHSLDTADFPFSYFREPYIRGVLTARYYVRVTIMLLWKGHCIPNEASTLYCLYKSRHNHSAVDYSAVIQLIKVLDTKDYNSYNIDIRS